MQQGDPHSLAWVRSCKSSREPARPDGMLSCWKACRVAFLAVFTWMFYAARLPALAILTTLWALSVAMSRAAMGRHYVGDVLAGLLLGLVTNATIGKVCICPCSSAVQLCISLVQWL